jgi:C1A family cysteine protease
LLTEFGEKINIQKLEKKSMSFKISRYGWFPDLPDHRDFLYSAPIAFARALPVKADLRLHCPPVYDQGQLGSCTANAIDYNERVMEHIIASDSGAQIRDSIKSVGKQGDCPETEWPYAIAKFKTRLPKSCNIGALKYKAVLYQHLTLVLSQLKGCLASGYPFVFWFTVYESFESPQVARTGHTSLPKPNEQILPVISGQFA